MKESDYSKRPLWIQANSISYNDIEDIKQHRGMGGGEGGNTVMGRSGKGVSSVGTV